MSGCVGRRSHTGIAKNMMLAYLSLVWMTFISYRSHTVCAIRRRNNFFRGYPIRRQPSRQVSSPYRPVRFGGASPSDLFKPDRTDENEDKDEDFGDDDERDDDFGRENLKEEARNELAQAGIRPWKFDLTPRYGRTSLSSKIIIANVVCYALQARYPKITQMGAKRSDLILSGRELYRLITPVFLHGGIGHLAMNAYSLSKVGPEVERLFGTDRFVATYLASGVAGNLLSAINSPNPSVGASSSIFGLMGAYYMCLSGNEVRYIMC